MSAFDDLIDQYLGEQFEESPVAASRLGVDGYDDELGDFSLEGFEAREEKADRWLLRFESVKEEELTHDEQIDRGLVISALKGRKIMRDWKGYRRNPGAYLDPILGGVFTLFLHKLHPEKELAASAASRMRKASEVLEEGKKNIDPTIASPLFVERAIGQCRAGIGYLKAMVPAEAEEEESRALLADAGSEGAAALEDYLTYLEKLAPEAKGDWAIGEERYSALLEEKEMLGYGAEEMLERGKAAFDDLDAEMRELSRSIGGSDDWRALIEELKKDHPADPEEMRKEYQRWTEAARQYLIDKDLVTLPEGERCIVAPSPPFQRPLLAVASYSSPPAFKPSLTGHFFVPYPPDGTPSDGVERLLQGSRRSGIPTISVHEAYPGHHWHLIKMQATPRPIRKVVRTSYFVEGWGLYAEKMMREEGFFEDPTHEFSHLDFRIFRAVRIIVDTSLHMGKMDPEQAFEFMYGKLGGSEPTLRTEIKRYCSTPTQAASYLTGSLEIEKMRDRYFREKRGSLKEFHDQIASTGGLPIGLAEKALFGG